MKSSELTRAELIAAVAPRSDMGERTAPLDYRLLMRLVRRMLRHRALFWWIMLLAVLLALLNVGIPWMLAAVIRGPIEEAGAFTSRFGIEASTGVAIGAGLMAALACAWYAIMRTRVYAVGILAERVVRDLRMEVYEHLQRLGMDFYDRTKVGRILARGTSDIDAIRSATARVAPRLVIALLQITIAVGAMFTFDAVLTLGMLALAPLVYIVNWRLRVRLSESYRVVQESYSILTANLAESILGIRVTQAFVREQRNAEIFDGICRRHEKAHMTTARAQGLYVPLLDVASQALIGLALLAGGWRVQTGAMTVGDLLGFMVMVGVCFQPVMVIGDMYNLVLQAMAGAERVFALLDEKPADLDPPPAEALPLPRTKRGLRVEFRDVTFAYVPDRPVLHDVTFTIEPGRTVAIVGHTGSGKTSVLNLMGKFYRCGSGEIRLDGIDISRIRQADLHEQMGIVLQENFLFSAPLIENIRFARPEASDAEVEDACRRLGCLDILQSLPQGLHTEVGEGGSSLSLGQRQLACFARALLADPRLFILDEATSAVDTITEHAVQSALANLLEGRTSVIVAHRLSTIRRADLILVMQAGRLVEHGTHEALLREGRIYHGLYEEFVRLSGRGRNGSLS